jgi:membrane-bound lytic murein transglycosylase A
MMHLSRAEIDGGAIDGKTKVIAWMASAVDRFFLQIQGSGFIRLPDGQRKKLQFAAKTTQPYTPVGRVLIERGEVAKEDMSMQAIRHWLETHPDQAEALMQENASYVFFSLEDAAEIPSGSHGVPLTPGQSLAVDTDMLPLGLPVFIDTQLYNAQRFAHLMIMQDTGSAIKGPLRGDIFFGSGDKAAELAGHQQAPGSWTLLVPKP